MIVNIELPQITQIFILEQLCVFVAKKISEN